MTNPDQTVGTNAGFDGRTTPNAMNDILGAFSRGRISGWACSPKSGMTVQLGGDGTTRDVAIAEDNAGNRLTINNRTATPVEITIAGAPATGNRIDSIVAYIANPPTGAGATSVDFPDAVGIIAVSGTAAGTPSAPNEATIRDAITADGASGASAYYVVLANITVGQGVTTIGSGVISAGAFAQISTDIVDPTPADGSITSSKLASNAVTTAKINANAVTAAKVDLSTFTSSAMPAITWDSGILPAKSACNGRKYMNLVLIDNAYAARSQTAWNTSWQTIGTLPTGCRPVEETIFSAIFTNLDTGAPSGYGRVRISTNGVMEGRAQAQVSNAYCCFSGTFATT